MVVIIATSTAPINPPSASPTITLQQFWQGMLYTATHTHEFVDSVESCEVIKRTEERIEIVQGMKLHPTPGHYEGEHRNEFVLSPPYKFDMTDTGATDFHCLAIVAPGPSNTTTSPGGPGDENSNLYFTVVYEWNEPSIRAGSKEHRDWEASHVRPEELVESAIRITRRLVGEGRL